MGIHARSNGDRHARRGLTRPSLFLLGLLVCLLFIPAATANAGVMAKYRGKYKNKLTYYRNLMDSESDTFYVSWKQGTEQTILDLRAAITDHPENVPIVEQMALNERGLLQDATTVSRDKTYAGIAAFKTKAVDWFATKADKNRFKAGLTTMRGGFVSIFSADESLMKALGLVGINADADGASNEVMAADMTRTTADTTFDKGWKQLLALQ
jgi:hypothetical protein